MFNATVRIPMVELLISHGADVNIQGQGAGTALHYAVLLKRRDLIMVSFSRIM
jgi:ankyrin repeat protein